MLQLLTMLLLTMLHNAVVIAQHRVVNVPCGIHGFVQTHQDEYVYISNRSYKSGDMYDTWDATEATIHRVNMNGYTKQIFNRSRNVNKYETGSGASSIDIVNGTVFVTVGDYNCIPMIALTARFATDADTEESLHHAELLHLCGEDSALVVNPRTHHFSNEPDAINGDTGWYHFEDKRFVKTTRQHFVLERKGMRSLLVDFTGMVWLREGCENDMVTIGEYRGEWVYWFNPSGVVLRNTRQPTRAPFYTTDGGSTWLSVPPFEGTTHAAYVLTDGTVLGFRRSVSDTVLECCAYDGDTHTWQVVAVLPLSVVIKRVVGGSLENLTLYVSGWPRDNGSTGCAFVNIDQALYGREKATTDSKASRWTLYDLLGNRVRSGHGSPELQDVHAGLYLLQQGEVVTKIVR